MSYLVKIKTGVGGYGADGVKCYFSKGGGGDSGQREATAEEKALWQAQADSLNGMNAVALPNLTTGMNNLGVMANESMDGTLAARLRGMAGADASAAMGQGLTGATQKLERYGSTMNPNALGAQMNNSALQGAAMKSSAMNQANIAAEDTRWNRNAALTGLASGQGAQALNGMGSLAGQIGQNRMNSNNMAMQAQQNQGNSMAGMLMGGKMMGMYKDGGEVSGTHFKDGEWHANGGMMMYKPVPMPTINPFSLQADDEQPAPEGGLMQTVANVAMPVMGTSMLASGLDKVGISAPKQAIDGLVAAGKDLFSGSPATATTGAGLTQAGTGTSAIAPNLANAGTTTLGSSGAGLKATGDLGVSLANAPTSMAAPVAQAGQATLSTAGANAATLGTQAGSSLASGLGAVAPWLIGGLALASMLDFKDGGSVAQGLKRKDMTKGGEVDGPGTSVSDSIPARLSDGEFVLNEGAVKMLGVDKLEAINQEGLKYRSEEPHLAGGGFLSALGTGLYQAAPMMMQYDRQKKQDEQWTQQQKTQQEQWAAQNARADATEARLAAAELERVNTRNAKKAIAAEYSDPAIRTNLGAQKAFSMFGPEYEGSTATAIPVDGGMKLEFMKGDSPLEPKFVPQKVWDAHAGKVSTGAMLNKMLAVDPDNLGLAIAQQNLTDANARQDARYVVEDAFKNRTQTHAEKVAADHLEVQRDAARRAGASLGLQQAEFNAKIPAMQLAQEQARLGLGVIDATKRLNSPHVNLREQEAAAAQLGSAQKAMQNLASVSQVGKLDPTSEMRNTEYLVKQGISRDKALNMAFSKKPADEQDLIISTAVSIMKNESAEPAAATAKAITLIDAAKNRGSAANQPMPPWERAAAGAR
jgi:hypothetical protein